MNAGDSPNGLIRRAAVRSQPYGFRATFRTWAEEVATVPHAVIDQAMSHQVGGAVERAYKQANGGYPFLVKSGANLMDCMGRPTLARFPFRWRTDADDKRDAERAEIERLEAEGKDRR